MCIRDRLIPSIRFFFRGWPRGVAMVAMVATSLKVTLGAVARHPGADVGYQGVLTGGTVAARVEADQGRADSTPTRGAPLASLGLGGATTRSVSDHRWPPWPPWPPLGQDSQKISRSQVGWVVLTSGHSPWIFFFNFSFRGWPWWPWWPRPTIERILPKLVGASALTRLGLPHTVCV